MEIRTLESAEELDTFVGQQPRAQFLQSWQWGEFQKTLGKDMIRIGVFENEVLVASALLIVTSLPFGQRYWYCPRGPIVNATSSPADYVRLGKFVILEIMNRAKPAGVLFVKIEPPLERSSKVVFDSLTEGVAQQHVRFVQPQDSLYLDVRKTEEELLQKMHPKTRYNIRLAEKKGVTVRISSEEAAIEKFWKINTETTQRYQFKSHDKEYYQKLVQTLAPSGQYKVFLAEREGKVLAANLVSFFGDTVTYVHGASSDVDRNVMAPHLLQWRQIQFSREQGAALYDFGGVSSATTGTLERWAGITRFKKGFGGQAISFVGAHNLIVRRRWYTLYKLIQRMR